MYLSKFIELCTKKVDLSCIQLLHLPDDMILFIKYIYFVKIKNYATNNAIQNVQTHSHN